MPSVAGLDPRLVAVDHDLDPVPHRVPDGRHDREVVTRVGAVKAELDRPEAVLLEPLDVVDPLLRRADLCRRAIDPDARRVASPELVDGQSGSFADDVPERDLHAVDGWPEDLRVAEDGRQPLDGERVLADPIGLHESLDGDDRLGTSVRGADARDPLVRLDLDEHHLKNGHVAPARPGRVERGVERELDETRYDVGDQHGSPSAASVTGVRARAGGRRR